MATKHTEQQQKPGYSRRKFVTWAGQVGAGISLAAIGLAGSNKALAATNPAQPTHPDCITCPPYGTVYREGCNSQCPDGLFTSYKFIYTGGCVLPGQSCPTLEICGRTCVSSCVCNV